MTILHVSLKHGWWYHYRLHRAKLDALCTGVLGPLREYLLEVFSRCPDEPFRCGPRSSALRTPLEVELTSVAQHPVCAIARAGLARDRYTTAHSNVQMQMLEEDRATIGVEVPLWASEDELVPLGLELSPGPLSGHIDALSVHEGVVWVWDYKPGAARERFAVTQLACYAWMLALRSGVGLDRMRCGYFDDEDCYVFDPCCALPLHEMVTTLK